MVKYDAIVVGAGPAGLTAATYLARFRRRVLVLDGGASRATWIPESHNTPGFPHGVSGVELLRRLTEQALEFGVELRPARAEDLARVAEGFEVGAGDGALAASCVLLATGVIDRKPELERLDEAIHRGLVRMCPICDAYEAIDKKIAVLGDGDLAVREAAFLRTYSNDVTVVASDAPLRFTETEVRLAEPGGRGRTFDHLYLALGCEMQSGLAIAAGAGHDDVGNLVVDTHQMTSVAGLYAAGDVVRGLNQIAVATGEAAIAATAIHNRLREAPA
jgi:thioredoxin reductase (NADPH)